jgi:hypothetical protein
VTLAFASLVSKVFLAWTSWTCMDCADVERVLGLGAAAVLLFAIAVRDASLP